MIYSSQINISYNIIITELKVENYLIAPVLQHHSVAIKIADYLPAGERN